MRPARAGRQRPSSGQQDVKTSTHSPPPNPEHCTWYDTVTRPNIEIPAQDHILAQDLGVRKSPAPPNLLAGRLALHLCNWKRLTQDQKVLQIVTGYCIEFHSMPVQTHHPVTTCPREEHVLMEEEISALLAKGAIVQVARDSLKGFFSTIFLIPKKDGKRRPVINLKVLNSFVVTTHFKMEGIQSVKELMVNSDWMTRIDLKDAYFAVPIHQEHQPFLRFIWANNTYQFTCLPFGLSTAPRTFTKLLKPVMAYLRSKGIRSVVFIDDILLMGPSEEMVLSHTALTLDLLESLGFLINYPKSHLTPARKIDFLGFQVDSSTMALSLPESKITHIQQETRRLLRLEIVSARQLARLIGKLSAAIQAVQPAPLHYRSLQRLKHRALAQGGYDRQIQLTIEAKADLQWWLDNLHRWNRREVRPSSPSIEIETDASQRGWRAYCNGVHTGGCWDTTEATLHINAQEMLAALYGIKCFARTASNLHILLRSDNSTVVAYVNHLGGTKSRILSDIVRELWQWCLDRGTTITAQHLPGLENVRADFMSRHLSDRTDWRLNPRLFNLLNQLWGPFTVDLFATRLSRQLPKFYSWRPDPESAGTNALIQDWRDSIGYAHPPWCLVGRVLQKVLVQEVTVTLIAPVWPSQPWYATLLSMLVDLPLLLPREPNTTLPSPNCEMPLQDNPPQLAAWRVSGNNSQQEEFRRRLQSSSLEPGGVKPTPVTTQHGRSGLSGAVTEMTIPFLHL